MTSPKSPLLAALATAAVPGMRVTATPPSYGGRLRDRHREPQATVWIVTCPPRSLGPPSSNLRNPRSPGRHTTTTTSPSMCPATNRASQTRKRWGVVHYDPGAAPPTRTSTPTRSSSRLSRARTRSSPQLPETVFSAIPACPPTAIECRPQPRPPRRGRPPCLWSRWSNPRDSPCGDSLQTVHGDIQEHCLSVKTQLAPRHRRLDQRTSATRTRHRVDQRLSDSAKPTATSAAPPTYTSSHAQLMSEIALVHWLVHGLHAELLRHRRGTRHAR